MRKKEQNDAQLELFGAREIESSEAEQSLEGVLAEKVESLEGEQDEKVGEEKIWSVSELTASIRGLLGDSFRDVWLEGEISNMRRQSSGHVYFTLKDDKAQISCALFRSFVPNAEGALEEGLEVRAFGSIDVYPPRGNYQLIVREMLPKGAGILQARFERLKKKLLAEGLFAAEYKRALPSFPRCVGVVSSPSGAALQDILNVLRRRSPWLRVIIYPCRVQGDLAAREIAAAINFANKENDIYPKPDLLIVGRGGGGIEDLWAFNEEIVARAIFASKIPLISAVGHEIDFTISDMVADCRAPTPSAAAELAAPDVANLAEFVNAARLNLARIWRERRRNLLNDLRSLAERLDRQAPSRKLRDLNQVLDETTRRLLRAKLEFLRQARTRTDNAQDALARETPKPFITNAKDNLEANALNLIAVIKRTKGNKKKKLLASESLLINLNPEAALRRGFSLTTDASGKILRSVSSLRVGQEIRSRLNDGELKAKVSSIY